MGGKRRGRAVLLCSSPKSKVSELAGVEDLRSLFLLRCCAASSDRETVLSGAAIVSVLTEIR